MAGFVGIRRLDARNLFSLATTWIAALIHDVWFGVSGHCKVSSPSVFAEITRT